MLETSSKNEYEEHVSVLGICRNRPHQSITSKSVPGIPLRGFWATAVELHSLDPDETRIPLKWSGRTPNGFAHFACKESYSVLHLMIFLTKSCPCLSAPLLKPAKPWTSPAAFQKWLVSHWLHPLQALPTCPSRVEDFFFSFSESKIKLEVHKSYKSAAGNKVTRFTAYDPNTCCAKLAFSHLNCHKMCLGWHFIFTICPYCKIKAVVPFFLGISLGLNSFLNACLCLIIILRHCFKSSFSLSNLSLPDSKAALELSVLRWLINWLTDYPDISINTASPATLTCACWWGKVGRHTNWRNCLNKEHY